MEVCENCPEKKHPRKKQYLHTLFAIKKLTGDTLLSNKLTLIK